MTERSEGDERKSLMRASGSRMGSGSDSDGLELFRAKNAGPVEM